MVTTLKTLSLRPPKAPDLPVAPTEYSQNYIDQLTNALRLYFAQIDNFNQPFASSTGGSFLKSPYGAFSSYATQTTTANTATLMTLNQTDFANGISLVGSKIIVSIPGIYNFQFSVQISNLDNATTDTSIWLKQNGVDIVGSNGIIGLSPRKSPGDPTHDIKGWNYFLSMKANDDLQIWWSTSSSNVSIETYAAGTSPTRPSTASVVATMSFVSALY